MASIGSPLYDDGGMASVHLAQETSRETMMRCMSRQIGCMPLAIALIGLVSCGPSREPPAATTFSSAPFTALEAEPSVAPTIPPAWPEGRDGTWSRFATVDAALLFLRRNMDVPIRLPAHLPAGGYELEDRRVFLHTGDGQRGAQFNLVFANGKRLILQYGVSGFDGCAPEVSRGVTVSGQPGRMRVTADPGGSPRTWTELIWPATLAHPTGVYGLSGWFHPARMLAMAESMPRLTSPPRLDSGC